MEASKVNEKNEISYEDAYNEYEFQYNMAILDISVIIIK